MTFIFAYGSKLLSACAVLRCRLRSKRKKMGDNRKRSRIWKYFIAIDNTKGKCRVCKKRISYRVSSTNNLHWHLRTVHPSVQWEEKVVEGGVHGGASVSTATVAAVSSASCSLQPQHPKSTTQSSISSFSEVCIPSKTELN